LTHLSEIGKAAGQITAGIAVAADTMGYLNGDISGARYTTNTAVAAIGLFDGPFGAGVAATYAVDQLLQPDDEVPAGLPAGISDLGP